MLWKPTGMVTPPAVVDSTSVGYLDGGIGQRSERVMAMAQEVRDGEFRTRRRSVERVRLNAGEHGIQVCCGRAKVDQLRHTLTVP
jgi:hypothetical protein